MANLPQSISNYLPNILPELNPITAIHSVGGGNISKSFKISSKNASVFLKLESIEKAGMFRSEEKALTILSKKSQFKIPKVKAQDSVGNYCFLVLEYVKMQSSTSKPKEFASLLADLHKNTNNHFGLDHDNFIGNLAQFNHPKEDWLEFYIRHRLEIQFELAYNQGYFSSTDQRMFSAFCGRLQNFIPKEKSALLHGDLWSGNYSMDTKGNHVLYDPSIYYGHREMDLAMMKLFGGFSEEVFLQYDRKFPLEPDWKERIPIHQLYPILVHANLFGISYIEEAKFIWKRWT